MLTLNGLAADGTFDQSDEHYDKYNQEDPLKDRHLPPLSTISPMTNRYDMAG